MRLIDADAFLADESEAYMNAQMKLAKENTDKTIDATRYINQLVHKKLLMLIADTPTIDAVEVVRCGECRHKYMKDFDMFCPHMVGILKPNMHCSYGEREGE